VARIKGNRYQHGGEALPAFLPFLHTQIGVKTGLEHEKAPQADIQIPEPNVNAEFLEELGIINISRRSFFKWERIMHSHGHTF